MTKTGFEFRISVIVICLLFDICDLEFIFLQYFSTAKHLAIYNLPSALCPMPYALRLMPYALSLSLNLRLSANFSYIFPLKVKKVNFCT